MKKARVSIVSAVALLLLGAAGVAEACPPCSKPWQWGGYCLDLYCEICYWAPTCNQLTGGLVVSQPVSTACAASVDEGVAALVAVEAQAGETAADTETNAGLR